MTAQSSKATEESQIRKLIDDQVKAIRDKDSKALMSDFAPDVLLFDLDGQTRA